MGHARAIRAVESQLRSKPFGLCRFTAPSANPSRFCRCKITSYLHILRDSKFRRITRRIRSCASSAPKSFCFCRSTNVGGRDLPSEALRRRAIPPIRASVLSCISFFFTYLRKRLTSKPIVFSYLRNYEGEGGTPSHHFALFPPSTSAHPRGRILTSIRLP